MKKKINIAFVFYFPKQIFTAKQIYYKYWNTEEKSQLLQKKTHTHNYVWIKHRHTSIARRKTMKIFFHRIELINNSYQKHSATNQLPCRKPYVYNPGQKPPSSSHALSDSFERPSYTSFKSVCNVIVLSFCNS